VPTFPIFNPPAIPSALVIPDALHSHPLWRWEFDERLSLLMDHFGIGRDDPGNWPKLALSLAMTHVPGFQEDTRRKGGRPREMTAQELASLYARFSELRQAELSDRSAASIMATDLRKAGRDLTAGAVLRRMQRYEKDLQTVAANMKLVMDLIDTKPFPPHFASRIS
jgi:hypothetical protein